MPGEHDRPETTRIVSFHPLVLGAHHDLFVKTLNIALLAIGCGALAGSALASSAQGSFYNPENKASGNQAGNTTGFELYRTIGCPGRALLDPGCVEDKKTGPGGQAGGNTRAMSAAARRPAG